MAVSDNSLTTVVPSTVKQEILDSVSFPYSSLSAPLLSFLCQSDVSCRETFDVIDEIAEVVEVVEVSLERGVINGTEDVTRL